MSQRVVDRLYTSEEFEKMPEFGERYELLDGRLIEKPMPNFDHSDISRIIMRVYDKFDPDENWGILRTEVSVKIREQYVPAPDLSFWKKGREPKRGQAGAANKPDLAIEIQSEGQSLASLVTKAKAYLKAGVSLVWIVQPNKKVVLVFRQGQDKPVTIQPNGKLEGEDVIPGFNLEVSELF